MNKLITALLILSLGLNTALVAVLATGASSRTQTSRAVAATPRAAKPKGPVVDATVWPKLNSGDLPSLVARLRETGFPPAMVRAIISAQLQEQFAVRRKALDPDADTRPFWKSSTMDLNVQNGMRQLYRDQQAAMRELLGGDADPDDPMSRAREARQFGHLPPEKVSEARRIVREFDELRSDVYSGSLGTVTTAAREKLAAYDRQMQVELKKIMTPQEYADYELRGSSTANSLRYQLAAFDTTETEFRTLFQLQRAFDDRFGQLYSQPSQEEMRLRGEAHRQLTEQIKAALGPVRMAEYERATNYEYRNASQLVARLELPPETTNKVYEVQKSIQAEVQDISRSSPSAADREKALARLAAEAQTKITALLGERGFQAYQQYGGSWLQTLKPRPAPGGAAAPAGVFYLRP
jgi:hypothetical protein